MDKLIKTINGVWVNPRYIISMELNKQGTSYNVLVVVPHQRVNPQVYNIASSEAAKIMSE